LFVVLVIQFVNIAEYSDSELNDYDLEEQSALAIQRRQAQLIDEQEFELQFAQVSFSP
jgi:hypothetical protein